MRSTHDSRRWSEEAAHWWVLLHGEGATSAQRREFLAWVARSPERIEAYLEVERLVGTLRAGTVRWPDTPVEALIDAARASIRPVALTPTAASPVQIRGAAADGAPRRSRARWAAGAAAAVALAAGLAAWLWMPGGAQIYRTRAGEQRSILLADGSRVTLNSASTVEVDLRRQRRVLHLLRGEALFQVSHDPARPFDVHADGGVVRAIGTEFNVDLRPHYAAVTVLQGRVAVMSDQQARLPVGSAPFAPPPDGAARVRPQLERFPAPAGALILGVAQQVRITPHGMSAPRPVSDLTATTAWTRRQLVFEHRPLGEVVDELDRDGRQHIVIASARLRARQVTGVIQLDDPGSLLEFLSDVPGVQIRRSPDGTRIVTLRRIRATHVSNAHPHVNSPRD